MGAADAVQQFDQRLGSGPHVRRERAAVPTGVGALDDQAVRAGGKCHAGLVSRRHRDEEQHPQCAEPPHDIRGRGTEGERHHLGPQVGHHLEFLLPAVVVAELGVTDLDPVVLGQLIERLRVVIQREDVSDTGLRHKQVDADRAGGGGACGCDLVGEALRTHVAAGQEAKAACVRHRRRQRRRSGAACHRRSHDWHLEIPEPQYHRATLLSPEAVEAATFSTDAGQGLPRRTGCRAVGAPSH